MKRTFVFTLSLFLAFSPITIGCKGRGRDAAGARNNPLATAEETVRKFLDLDAEGARLASTTWPKVLPYISWQEEPGWDSVVVISGYTIARAFKQSETVEKITVEYNTLGKLSKDYAQNKAAQPVIFTLKKTRAGWKIQDPEFILPHVLPRPLSRHLEETKNMELARKVRDAAKE